MKLKSIIVAAGMLLGLTPRIVAQNMPVDYSKYPDYTDFFNPDNSLYTYGQGPRINQHGAKRAPAQSERPDHVDNSQKMFFPPVFNQQGGSCGSASRICYMFTHELNTYRNLSGKDPNNYYPSHFVWLLTNGNSGKDQFVQFVGVPSAAIYGGQTYSSLFGAQVETNDDFGWMTGYDKWYAAMFNRMWAPAHIPSNVGTDEGREQLKNWLWNHNGDNDFHAGGIAGIGVASGGDWQKIPKTDKNDELGVTGKYYVKKWGTSVDHALTIVGYDDRIQFDLDGNGKYGEDGKDETGAWIVVNSWGSGWCNGGFIYCPYKHAVPAFTADGQPNNSYYTPEIYHVRKDYKPERTIKLKMDYNRRSEIALSAGISTDLNATEPDQTIPFHHFQYAGDGKNGNTNPAPEIPMLGRWADGKLHTEPMEFGYDLTDLTAGANRNLPIKYFFIVNTKSWAQGSGHIYEASIMDYKIDTEGIETPFACSETSPVEIKSKGNKTIISCIVYGDGYTEPRNLHLGEEGKLTWEAPARSGYTLDGYNVYVDGVKAAGTKNTNYQFETLSGNVYGVTAVYTDGNETEKVTVNAPVEKAEKQTAYEFTRSGFSIPDVFKGSYGECTIEFLIRPKSLANWNQSAGPGWGTFMMHANADGSFTAGWNTTTNDRGSTSASALKVGSWTHIAVVVNKNNMRLYVNGILSKSFNSSNYTGIGGFGDLTFTANTTNNAYTDALFDEIRIWNYARTATQITKNKYAEFSGTMLPEGLLAYYKGGTLARDGKNYMLDVVGGHHAEVLTTGFKTTQTNTRSLTNPSETATIAIDDVEDGIVAGMPVTLSATRSTSIQAMAWSCAEAGLDNASVQRPTVIFPKAGEYNVKVTGYTYGDEVVEAEKTIAVGVSGDVDATFTMGKQIVPAGEHVTFAAANPQVGYIYIWSMPGARKEEACTMAAGATYEVQGKYTVTLTVTSPDGKSASSSQEIEVTRVAPRSSFTVSPNVIVKGQKTYLVDESKMEPETWMWNVSSDSKTYIVNGRYTSLSPDEAGIYNISLTTSNDIGQNTVKQDNALYVCNADSKNGLSMMGYPNAAVTAPAPFREPVSALTVDFWLATPSLSDFCNGIGDSKETFQMMMSEAGALVVYVNGKSVASNDGFVLTTGWHHYAITVGGTTGKVSFYRDGVLDRSQNTNKKEIPAIEHFMIGGGEYPMNGRIDELRVWNKTLTQTLVRKYAVEPIADVAAAQTDDNLLLYYDFNQSGGDVQDRTSNALHGVRTGFGPDGDAWGLSQGVFALSFSGTSKEDVTSTYLKNVKKPFSRTTATVNNSVANRFYTIKEWTLENQIKSNSVTTGVHVDVKKANCFTSTVGWDGFATLTDHKAFQTVTLPAGLYTFTATYDDTYEGQCGNSYLVAAAGTTLPDTENLSSAIAYQKMDEKGTGVTENTLTFIVDEDDTEVSLGMLINQTDKICMTIQRFTLKRGGVTILEADGQMPDSIDEVTESDYTTSTVNSNVSVDLQGRRISTPTRPGLYIINGHKVIIK